MGWQWHKLDHLHLVSDRKPCQHLITQCFTGWMPNQQCQRTEGNRMLICWSVNTSFKPQDVDITQQIVAIYPQPLTGRKPKPTKFHSSCSFRLTLSTDELIMSILNFHTARKNHEVSMIDQCVLSPWDVKVCPSSVERSSHPSWNEPVHVPRLSTWSPSSSDLHQIYSTVFLSPQC